MPDPLFMPITINTLSVKNRIVMPAMHLGMADNYRVTDQILAFYKERALGQAGLITVGFATVDEFSGNTLNIGAHSADFIPGLERLATVIRENGSRSCVQLNHAGRYNMSFFMNGKLPVAPSPVPSNLTRETPRELDLDGIRQIVEAFASAALRVKQAGFDSVEILCGTGYLISEFLSPLTNLRTDAYGGSFENRCRFGLEILQAIRERVGDTFPVIVRMNGNDFMPGGLGRDRLLDFAQAVATRARVDALCINVGWHEARVPQITASVPRGAFGYLARGIREKVAIPVIASHRINDPDTARELIRDGLCDMVAMGRSLIADPMLPEKTAAGREKEIIHCTGCAQGCFDNLFRLKHVECLCNPRAGHELDRSVVRATDLKKIMVIGGGPAGMMAAIAASDRGHAVSLHEKSSALGGQLHLAAAPPGRSEFGVFARDLACQVSIRPIRVCLDSHVDRDLIMEESPDHIVLATGVTPMTPPIPGVELPHVVQAWDVLQDRVHTGKRVVIIGGGAVGVETALFLAEKGTLSAETLKFLLVNRAESLETLYDMATIGTRRITILEMQTKIGKDFGKTTRWGMLQDVQKSRIETRTATRALSITPEGIQVETTDGKVFLEADTIVLAVGARPENSLVPVVEATNIPFQTVGDARAVGMAFDAVHQGFMAGMSL
ncbi:MAG: FAD-dependent oxidoreductase [Pseudomonadota bacterium]